MGELWKNIGWACLGTFVYGCVLGWWRSPLMAGYVGIKLPMVFVFATILVCAISWMTAQVIGCPMRMRDVFDCLFGAMAVAGRILMALAPVALFMILSGADDVGTRDELRFTHACLMLMHLVVLSVAGFVGVVRLYRRLSETYENACRQSLLLVCWLSTFALVGSQVGWMLLPLVGSPNIRVEFVRDDALDGNVLESLATQIIPHFINKGAIR